MLVDERSLLVINRCHCTAVWHNIWEAMEQRSEFMKQNWLRPINMEICSNANGAMPNLMGIVSLSRRSRNFMTLTT